jgi:hypothetical protein
MDETRGQIRHLKNMNNATTAHHLPSRTPAQVEATRRENADAMVAAYEAGPAAGLDRVIAAVVYAASVSPQVGDGANKHCYSDVQAYTVISVSKSGRSAVIQRDKATLLNGHNSDAADKLFFEPGGFCGHTSGTQRYAYERDPNGSTERITFRTKGKFAGTWRTPGQNSGAARVSFGERSEHYDFNF